MLRRLLLSAGVMALAASAALAADMSVPPVAPPPTYAPIATPAPYYDWTGFYLGGNAGAAWVFNNGTTSTFAGTTTQEFSNRSFWGFAGGGQVGFNWFFLPSFVLGAEGDFSALTNKSTLTDFSATVSQTDRPQWVSTARARFGLTADRWMWYGTGGVAWSEDRITRTQLVASASSSAPAGTVETVNRTNIGFAVGTGLEYAIMSHLTTRLEFLYVGLGNQTYSFPVSMTRSTAGFDSIGLVRFGLNYKFGGGDPLAPISARY